MTVVQQLKQRNERNRKLLLQLLDITEEQMNEKLFEGAYEYLENIFGTDAYGMKHLPKTSEFWTWWQMEWAKIDSIFIAAIDDATPETYAQDGIMYKVRDRDNERGKWRIKSKEELTDHYLFYHEANMKNRYINSDIMHAGAHAMIKEIKKREQEVVHG